MTHLICSSFADAIGWEGIWAKLTGHISPSVYLWTHVEGISRKLCFGFNVLKSFH